MSVPLRDEVLEILRRHKAELAERYGVTDLGVFGSVVRDETGGESDVDIVFTTESPNLFRTGA